MPRFYNSYDHRHPPLARINSGDTIVTKTLDAAGYDQKMEKLGGPGNPLTGPFFIEGAEAGDAIAVTFHRIRMNRNSGWSYQRLGLYSITPEQVEGLYRMTRPKGEALPGADDVLRWDFDFARGTLKLYAPSSTVHALEFPGKPMLG